DRAGQRGVVERGDGEDLRGRAHGARGGAAVLVEQHAGIGTGVRLAGVQGDVVIGRDLDPADIVVGVGDRGQDEGHTAVTRAVRAPHVVDAGDVEVAVG